MGWGRGNQLKSAEWKAAQDLQVPGTQGFLARKAPPAPTSCLRPSQQTLGCEASHISPHSSLSVARVEDSSRLQPWGPLSASPASPSSPRWGAERLALAHPWPSAHLPRLSASRSGCSSENQLQAILAHHEPRPSTIPSHAPTTEPRACHSFRRHSLLIIPQESARCLMK